MFYIGICDDEAIHREYISELCKRYFEENPQDYKIIEFESGEEMLSYPGAEMQPGERFHLLFLDVEMSGLNGIEVLRLLEDKEIVWRVVFVTSHEEVALDAFGIKTLGFVKKPLRYEQVCKWLKIAIAECKENVQVAYIDGTQTKYIALEEIYYLEAQGNYTYLHTAKERTFINDNLKYWETKLEKYPFVRIHKSYLINMLQVKEWHGDEVILQNKVRLSIGRAYAKEARERYLTFVKKQAFERM